MDKKTSLKQLTIKEALSELIVNLRNSSLNINLLTSGQACFHYFPLLLHDFLILVEIHQIVESYMSFKILDCGASQSPLVLPVVLGFLNTCL